MRINGKCNKRCIHGNPCFCHKQPYHELHICSNPECPCHSKDRYEGKAIYIQSSLNPLTLKPKR